MTLAKHRHKNKIVIIPDDQQWLNFLFCKPKPDDPNKQMQIELGSQPGESTYRTKFLQISCYYYYLTSTHYWLSSN